MNILKIADSKFEIADLFIPSAAWKGGAIVPRIAFSLTQNQMRHCFDSSAGFTLPNGAVRAPDAAWVLREKWDALTKEERMKFAPVVPNFIRSSFVSASHFSRRTHAEIGRAHV